MVVDEENVSTAPTRKRVGEKKDYRAFVFVIHPKYGLLLLHCTRKPKKGPHHQLPGGHVDPQDFPNHEETSMLLEGAKNGAARELFEETGLDVRHDTDRLQPAVLRKRNHDAIAGCELNQRLYFVLQVTDDDFLSNEENLSCPMSEPGKHLQLKLSHEHQGFVFEPKPQRSVELLTKHSGGNGSKALLMSMQHNCNNY